MSAKRSLTTRYLNSLLESRNLDNLAKLLVPDTTPPLSYALPNTTINDKRCQRIWHSIGQNPRPNIYDGRSQ
ncbi:MAG: hypothetical protein ABGY95_06260 [Rubritalea sp.]|uniref:hypothetical protein n=1 Tax=Rubritalea sp. TaxID=2109375 RepID=UPI0032425B22